MAAMSRIWAVTGGLVVFILACGPQVVNTRSVTGGPSGSNTSSGDASGFAFAQAKALMDKSCNGAGCHTAPATGAGGIPLDNLADVKKYFDVSMASVGRGDMPIAKPKWTDAEIKSLNDWKAAGFPEKAAPAAPAGGAVSFAKDIAGMVKTSCAGAGCHEGDNAAAGIPLLTLEENKLYWELSLEDVTKTPPTMPIGRPLWTADQVAKFKAWGDGGFAP